MKMIQVPWTPKLGIMLFGILFTRDKSQWNSTMIRHEKIHVRQMWELFVIGFYLCYVIESFIRLCRLQNAYRDISFEREAYSNQGDPNYLKKRKLFSFLKYL